MTTYTPNQYRKGVEDLVMIPCSMCDHVHGAHTWNQGCVGVSLLNMMGFISPTPLKECDCPGFLSFTGYTDNNGKEEKGGRAN